MSRLGIKRNHEKKIINAFLSYYNASCETNFVISQQPDPPDAIITFGALSNWVEHCDAYRSAVEAQTDYESTFNRSGRIYEPDKQMAYAVITVIRKKFAKESYTKAFSTFGAGILLISVRDPLFSDTTLRTILNELRLAKNSFDGPGYFAEVYLTWNSTNIFVKVWPKVDRKQVQSYITIADKHHLERARAWKEIAAKSPRKI